MTGQEAVSGYGGDGVGLGVVVALVNDLTGRVADDTAAVARILSVDPPSFAEFAAERTADFVDLANRLRPVVDALAAGDVDLGANLINELLREHSAQPHLANDDGLWCLHHHPADADLVAMWTAITADGLARLVADGHGTRIGRCRADDCGRCFLDKSRNGSRQFCSTTCQNRTKATAFRRRHARLSERP